MAVAPTLTLRGGAISMPRPAGLIAWLSTLSLPIAVTQQGAYHLGRLVTYSALGAAGGLLGSAIDHTGAILGLQRVALTAAGGLMIIFGALAITRWAGVRLPDVLVRAERRGPGVVARAAAAGHRRATRMPPVQRSAVIGMLTTLLPCGWLYAFVITAAGTADAGLGVAVMVAFWLGTLPMLVGLGAGLRSLAVVLGRHRPALVGVLMIGIGLLSLWGRTVVTPAMFAHVRAVDMTPDRLAEMASGSAAWCHPNVSLTAAPAPRDAGATKPTSAAGAATAEGSGRDAR